MYLKGEEEKVTEPVVIVERDVLERVEHELIGAEAYGGCSGEASQILWIP